jgi:predicted lipoprotein with Yx(FWY)xxD motif
MRRRKVLLVGTAAVLGLALAACGDDSGSSSSATLAASSAPAATAGSTAAGGSATTAAPGGIDYGYGSGSGSTAATTPAATGTTVSVVDNPTLGPILVGPDGRTLYLFQADSGTTTACTGACASAWPALAAASPSAGAGVDASKLQTANAQVANQVVYNGHLLYYYAKDTKPGDVLGNSVPKWKAVTPAGDAVAA